MTEDWRGKMFAWAVSSLEEGEDMGAVALERSKVMTDAEIRYLGRHAEHDGWRARYLVALGARKRLRRRDGFENLINYWVPLHDDLTERVPFAVQRVAGWMAIAFLLLCAASPGLVNWRLSTMTTLWIVAGLLGLRWLIGRWGAWCHTGWGAEQENPFRPQPLNVVKTDSEAGATGDTDEERDAVLIALEREDRPILVGPYIAIRSLRDKMASILSAVWDPVEETVGALLEFPVLVLAVLAPMMLLGLVVVPLTVFAVCVGEMNFKLTNGQIALQAIGWMGFAFLIFLFVLFGFIEPRKQEKRLATQRRNVAENLE